MTDHFIAEQDDICSICGGLIEVGDRFEVDCYDNPVCLNCLIDIEESEGTNCLL